MTTINRTARTATLSLADSIIIAGSETPDGRDLDDARRRVRAEVQPVADELGKPIEVYSCRSHGGCIVDVVEPRD